MVTLASQLAQLADPKVQDFDPEDAERKNPDEDSSEEEEEGDERATEHYVDVGKSKLRDDELKVDGVKYKGSKISRSDLYDQSSDSEEEDVMDDSESEEEGDSEDESEGESESGDELQPVAQDEETKRRELKKLMAEEQKKIVGRLSSTARADAEKGQAVQHQTNIYEGFLDSRINMQKAISAANILPIDCDIDENLVSDDTPDLQDKAISGLVGLMDKISGLRVKLMKNDKIIDQSFELKKFKKKRTLSAAFEDVQSLESPLGTYRDGILEKWSRKIQSSSGSTALQNNKFRSLNQTAAVQVNSVLADMDRLTKRTRTNRSNYKILGQADNPDNDGKKVDAQENEYIFDDTDFYRLQLKDLVDRRMADSANSGDSMKWAVSNAKVKKNIDTKASKGRKLRYQVQERVQGFDAPRPQTFPWTDEKTDELFSSLFGGAFRLEEESDEQSDGEEEEELLTVNDGVKIFG